MATVMEIQEFEAQTIRRPNFSAIRWGAVFGGVASGSATYLLLTLLGVAVGLTAIDPREGGVAGVTLATGIWTGISLLASAFVGGYVAGRLSGLARASDGMLHGFVSWGVTTLLYVFLAMSALGAVLGGTFRVIGEVGQVGAQAAGGSENILNIIAGGAANANPQTLRDVQQAVAAGDRERAVNVMVQDLGMSPENANQIVDRVTPLLSQQGQSDAAARAADALSGASWWLFAGLLLSLGLGVYGGATGVRATARRVEGDHSSQRHIGIERTG
jgi:hypothetical protein